MSFTDLAGVSGIGFVVLAILINLIYIRSRLPMPVSSAGLEAVADDFAKVGPALRRPSVMAPATWLFLTIFAAGMLSVSWQSGEGVNPWALVGFAGVIMQNATFTVVEALRFGMASAAAHDRGSVAGLWGMSNVLFGFNQGFLAIALLGFTAAGAGAGILAGWTVWLGYASAALLFLSSVACPYNADGRSRISVVGLIGWLGWAVWIVTSSISLMRL